MPFINDKLEYYAAERRRKEMEEKQRVPDVTDSPADQPIRKIQTRFRFDVEEVMKRLRNRILGQEHVLKSIENMLKIVRADIADPDKPLYIGLFLGPTGVGKTEIVRVLAEAIHGSRESFCRVDMNTLSLDHYAAALTGAPPGYVGSREGSTIFDKEKIEGSYSRPGILLFDEIEKASPQVIQTLLNVFDNGVMTIASGEETIDFRNTLIFMTSNLGAREIQSFADNKFSFLAKQAIHFLNPVNWKVKENETILDHLIKRRLESSFRPEFINRIDDIITFNWLTRQTLFEIIDLFTEQINRKLRRYGCELELDVSAKEFLLEKGYDRKYGARALKRAVRKYVMVPLAELLMEQTAPEGLVSYKARGSMTGIEIKVMYTEIDIQTETG
ncbi:ATP-dependent protease ATP-binding subunit-like protein AmiB [Collibacillus ludicampi]|uniref:ATP-dependent protease ATP-binding subunit-like protein AmiB n=1 Tax=Collibacillus ludicampi TaxID=2771369 RepID=A0AAV4LEU4_9BACL|nr:AAA family ATPase [Collibacillus ludicampi]GIM46349.1 ATP-dependent protease ATP-binding subunit-like protein AmiB [Collibacillus ludicampi]